MLDTSLLADNPFLEFSALLLLAAVFGIAARFLKQPLIVAFIALGIIAGPSALDLIYSTDQVHLLAEVGIAILLFVVGLKLDVSLIKTTGGVALSTGLGQVLFTSLFGFLIALALGFSAMAALYIAIALTFSSTIIIVKLLSDKREIDALHGQIAIGFLIVQDIVVILVMIVLSAMALEGTGSMGMIVGGVVLKGFALVVFTGLMMKYVLPRFTNYLAGNQELLVLFAIAWAVALAAGSDLMGFSREVGAFLAGVSLASTHYREVISGRLVSIRDFLLLFFFIHLGSQLDLSLLGAQVWAALALSVFVLVGNPIIVMVIMGLMGYRKRTGFLAGLTVAQISEFSLIFAALGLTLGHISDEVVGLITLVGLITIAMSTYMILYSHPLFERLSPLLSIFEQDRPHRESEERKNAGRQFDVIVFGLGRYGGSMARKLKAQGNSVLAVDFDPQAVRLFQEEGIDTQYGDLEDPDLAEQLPISGARFVISSVPMVHGNRSLVKSLRANGFEGKVIVTAHHEGQAAVLRREPGIDRVLMPFIDAAEQICEHLEKA
ncbi:cation:proton antiporter [Marinimicrobium alkaliphilum]|uniref:cation:proton antiporter n=1 Tax=Marinimicrobium alkaliphilum TaxID=2202654 RepID=UPI000DB9B4C8|nr:cation:proton antiporter family protein [Marinimicrobium alkaliphilum]